MDTVENTDDDLIYIGIANPKGESIFKESTYLDESQLDELAPRMHGLPVHIDHRLCTDKGEKVPPCGYVVKGVIHPVHKNLWIGFHLADTPMGEFARKLIKEHKMNELSLGYDIGMKNKPGSKFGTPIFNTVNEVSICWQGAREGT
ncbi:MAG: hypothetical protein AABY22_28830, partial [Nanoarchaeota archaeon]